jgi:hypothetical protein
MAKITADKINLSICLTDIPKDKITTGKNGKKYLSLDIIAKKEVDQYGKDLAVALGQTADERRDKVDAVWLGNGKSFVWEDKNATPTPAPKANSAPSYDDDLGF